MKIDIENAIRVTMPPAEAEIVIAELERLRQQNSKMSFLLGQAVLLDNNGLRLPQSWFNYASSAIAESEKTL